ncbi:hypothetical protein ABVT39_017791 [Epinephelus coioides]
MIGLTLCKERRSYRVDTGRSSHIKDILTNESYSNAYTARDLEDCLSIFYALHYINVQRVPEGEIKEMLEIKDAYTAMPPGRVIVLTFRQTYNPNLFADITRQLQVKSPIPLEREQIKKKQCIKVY